MDILHDLLFGLLLLLLLRRAFAGAAARPRRGRDPGLLLVRCLVLMPAARLRLF